MSGAAENRLRTSHASALERRAHDLAALHEALRDLSLLTDVPTLLQTLLERVVALLESSSASVFLHDEASREMVVAATRHGSLTAGTRFALHHGLTGRVAATGRPLLVDDYQTWEHRLPELASHGVHAVLLVPMTTGGRLVGALGVGEYTTGRKYDQDDAHLLSLFAAHAAASLRSVQLLEATLRHAGELERDNERRRVAEEALRHSEERYRSLVEDMNDVIYTFDETGRFTYISPVVEQMTGHKPEELFGRSFTDFVHPDDRPFLIASLSRVLERRREPIEFRIFARDGQLRWCRSSSRRHVVGGVAVGITGCLTDVTEVRSAHDEIRRLNEALEQRVHERTAELAAANKELEAFGYSVSHDLRGPLRVIEGFSQLLTDEFGDLLGEKGVQYLESVRGSTRRMAQLIQDLLNLSRVTRNAIERRPVDLASIATSIVGELRRAEPARDVDFEITQDLGASGDPSMLRMVVENLLGNSWKYTSRHPSARIEFGSRRERGEVVFFVQDDGAGFDMKYADKLFLPFQRLHLPGEFDGTGVGLAIVDRIVRRHGGRVWADGQVEAGATIFFTLAPARDPEATAAG
ncbi:MAG TPA: PAS domain S-box protein [Candidatus Binatia bacterium]|jgi:PAS domain S-box-containing protein